MKKAFLSFAAAAVFGVSSMNAEQSLVAGWNFNDLSDAPASQMGVSHGSGTMTTNWAAANIANFGGNSINLVPGDGAGADIAFQNGGATGAPANEGNWVQFEIDMTGSVDLQLSYAGRTTSSGMRGLTWSWSLDGESFTDFSLVNHFELFAGANYGLVELDFSSIPALNNQPQVFVRGTFTTVDGQANPTATGNTRIDNVQFRADAPSSPGTATLVNAAGGSPYSGKAIFAAGTNQAVALTVTGSDSTPLSTVEISLPEGWSGLTLGNVGLSGAGFSGANSSVAGDTLTISNASVTDSAQGTVIFSNLTTPTGAAILNWGRFAFVVRTAVAGEGLDTIGSQPQGNLVIPISLIRPVNEQGIPLAIGRLVAVSGVATVSSGVFHQPTGANNRFSTYLQDDTGAVALDNPSLDGFWDPATAGNRYTAIGTVGQFRGLTQIEVPDQDAFINHGPDQMPEPLLTTINELLENAEDLEGTLVRIVRASKTAGVWPELGDNAELTIMDPGGSSPLTLFINRFTDITFNSEPTWPQDVVGIFSQFSSASAPFVGGYQIVPRAYSDFLPASDPEDGAGAATLVNATGGSPFQGTTIFASGTQQTVSLTLTGEDPASVESVSITLPDGWSGLSLGNVGLSGTGFNSATPSVSGDTLTISNAALTGSALGTVTISNLTTPAEGAIVDYGVSPFTVKTALSGGTLTTIAGQPQGNLIIPISLVRAVDAQGVALATGQTVAISGVATVSSGVFEPARFSGTIQDETAGVAIDNDTPANFPAGIVAGNRYAIVGEINQFRGQTQIDPGVPSNIIDLGPDTMPEPLLVTVAQLRDNPESFEALLVRVARVSRTNLTQEWAASGGFSISIGDDTASPFTMRVQPGTDIPGSVEPEWPLDLVGVVGQFSGLNPPWTAITGYRVQPRATSDFLPASDPVDPEGGFTEWQDTFFGIGEDPSISAFWADPEGDGVQNLLEYALGGNPFESSRHLLPEISVAGDSLQITFRRVKEAFDVIYTVNASSDLTEWTEIWSSLDHPYTSAEAVVEEMVTDTVSLATAPKRFLRLSVELVE